MGDLLLKRSNEPATAGNLRTIATDAELKPALMGCLAEQTTLRPSVEAALHGLALTSVRRGTWGTPIPRQ